MRKLAIALRDERNAFARSRLHSFGHRFLYDEPTLTAALTRVGFEDVTLVTVCQSEYPTLRGLEIRTTGDLKVVNEYEVLIVEGRRSARPIINICWPQFEAMPLGSPARTG